MQVGAGSSTRCLVVDDHEALRAGVIRVLEREDDMEVVGETGDHLAVLALLERRRPDVTILDLGLPGADGIELCRRICATTDTKVVVFTGRHDVDVLEQALDAGVAGFVLKLSPVGDLVRAVRAAMDGRLFVDSALGGALARGRSDDRPALSEREREVLQHLADGMTTDGVAMHLHLSPTTVRSYAENAMRKLETNNRPHAVARALRLQLIR